MNPLLTIPFLAAALLVPGTAGGQSTNEVAELPTAENGDQWSFYASLTGYLVPDSRDYLNPIITADHGWLHLEARYNYEAFESGSLWMGYNVHFGNKLAVHIAPMLGCVFGDLTGVAPGYSYSVNFKRLELSSQGEYVFDIGDSSRNFFYTWTELSYSPWDWLRAGLVVQRTKLYHTDLDLQRGFLVGVTYRKVDLTAYVFNLGWTDPTLVLATGFSF